MNRILVVEDHDAVAMGLRYGLEKEGFQVERAATAAEARRMAAVADLILLDVRLPDGDGFQLCRELRASGLRQPVIMLTARDDLVDKIVGLEVGADDYMTKPFELREVIARIRAHLRRAYGPLSAAQGDLLRVGPLSIDLAAQRVVRNGEEIQLTATEFKLLVFLAQHADRPVDRHTLLDEVWGYDAYVGDPRTVDVHIRNLRQKIEEDPQEPRLIVTVRGAGYKLAQVR